jgi:CheY-like chemotaxis protein
VLTARSGPKALETIERYQSNIDAIVCDLGMPGMSGVELFEAISDRWPQLQSRVRFMSGAPEWGADGSPVVLDRRCYRKPLEIPELLEDVDALISDRRGEG